MEQTIPVVDLRHYRAPETRAAFVATFGDALRDLGFVALEGHGIAQRAFDASYDAFRRFFALPDTVKRRFERPSEARQRGYTSFGVEHAKDNPAPDLKEFFHIGRELPPDHPHQGRLPRNVWPDELLPELRPAAMGVFEALDEVAFLLLEALSTYLGEAPRALPELAEGGNTVQRIIHYPVCEAFERPGAMRAAQHEDINLMTLLPPADESGLEILTRAGQWLPIAAVPGQIIVDTGDMMKRITNDRIPATTHRVVNPTGEARPRYSMPFFVHPRLDATLAVLPSQLAPGERPKYPPISSETFLLRRLEAIGVKPR